MRGVSASIATTEIFTPGCFIRSAELYCWASVIFLLQTHAASSRGAAGGRVVDAVYARAIRNGAGVTNSRHSLERQEHVKQLLAVAILLYVGDLAAATIGNTRLGDLG